MSSVHLLTSRKEVSRWRVSNNVGMVRKQFDSPANFSTFSASELILEPVSVIRFAFVCPFLFLLIVQVSRYLDN